MNFEQSYRSIWAEERAPVLATLIRLLGSFDLAEEATQDAFAAALIAWPNKGIPANPRGWLISAGRYKAIDRLRREATLRRRDGLWTEPDQEAGEEQDVEDDRLRLIFTCCHPALSLDAQVALTLRTVCGLSTETIARAYLQPVPTIAQRLVRVKTKIRDAGIPYTIPRLSELAERLEAVLLVTYLIFNEGYDADSAELNRRSLCDEAIRLARLLLELMPAAANVQGLLALLLLQQARGSARFDAAGELVLLAAQDRSRWNRTMIHEGSILVARSLQAGLSDYGVQAAIAAVHDNAEQASATDWPQIVSLYELLLRLQPSPVVELNRAVAVAMAQNAQAGLKLIDEITGLDHYGPFWAAKAYLLVQAGQMNQAKLAYGRAIGLATSDAQQRFLQGKLAQL